VTRRLDPIEEIINDTLFVVWNRAASYQPEAKVSTWIFGIAYKKCLKALAEQRAGDHLDLDDAEDLIPGVQDSGLKNIELEDWVAVAFSKLPTDQRAVLELAYHHDLHYHEIAEIMNCPENTVKTRMFHARKKIRALFPELLADSHADNFGNVL
jgi:RNA polymerase sigma-70 factor (ECF subfamily)